MLKPAKFFLFSFLICPSSIFQVSEEHQRKVRDIGGLRFSHRVIGGSQSRRFIRYPRHAGVRISSLPSQFQAASMQSSSSNY